MISKVGWLDWVTTTTACACCGWPLAPGGPVPQVIVVFSVPYVEDVVACGACLHRAAAVSPDDPLVTLVASASRQLERRHAPARRF